MSKQISRPEYPRPQFERKDWINLNGTWTYVFDFGESGRDPGRELFRSKGFESKINVPFCPESVLSGVGYKDFIPAMWYHRKIKIPAEWAGRLVILNFGAVDYECEVYIDGKSAGVHFGGTVSFAVDITRFVKAGKMHDLVVRVLDHCRGDTGQPRGKQQHRQFKSAGCSYTRTTGIWQTVWLEAVAKCGLKACFVVPDLDNGRFILTPEFYSTPAGTRFSARLLADGKACGAVEGAALSGASFELKIKGRPKTWSPESPFLYDIELAVTDATGAVVDTVASYAGLRKIHIEDGKVFLNNSPLYQRLVLDQGFYPDGVWTAPSDAALKRDIELSMAAGFNGARLHQKVFEERFHYWADRLGYLTWGESSSWGCNPCNVRDGRNFITEWREVVVRDRNHPSIIAWTPFNETGHFEDLAQLHRLQSDAYDLTKSLDPTRPVNDASGWLHAKTDLWTIHDYARADELVRIRTKPGEVYEHEWMRGHECDYCGQPYLLDEFGGLKWIGADRVRFADNTWGYGNDIPDLETLYKILSDEVDVILSVPHLWGFCYTQLTDVEQEQNGIYYFDRTPKFDMAKIREIFARKR